MKGNGLTVVFPESGLDRDTMQAITREFRQIETIFIYTETDGVYNDGIFTMDEELEFAGHPILGAAAVVHHLHKKEHAAADISFRLKNRIVSVKSFSGNSCYRAVMNQGRPDFLYKADHADCAQIISALNLSTDDLHTEYTVETVSTGLHYLILPLKKNIDNAKIIVNNFEEMLAAFKAKFVYLFQPDTMECRTWDNAGITEDAGTGSAAGPLCAYLVKNGFNKSDEVIGINQGRFAGRPCVISGKVDGKTGEVFIEGDVAFFAAGAITGL